MIKAAAIKLVKDLFSWIYKKSRPTCVEGKKKGELEQRLEKKIRKTWGKDR